MRINFTSPTTIRNLAIVAAVLLAPVLSFGAASLMDLQKVTVSAKPIAPAPTKLVNVPRAETETLPADLIEKISEAIVLAETKG